MPNLADKRVLVVGGSSGIGLATAIIARQAGADVLVASRHQPDNAEAMAHMALDISDEAAVAAALTGLEPFDHLIITAGGADPAKFRATPAHSAMAAFQTKFWGAWRVAALAPLTANASITFVSGVFAERPAKRNVAATCVNAALEALARSLAVELAPIRVNAVSPGLVDTPMWSAMPEDRRAAYFQSMAEKLPVGQICSAQDIAAAIVFCMCNPVMTGTVLKLDGGYTLV
ncbi:MAG: hypothetical protein RLY97_1135 [Pseudomonadota bacterium]|jgi:NAD(P)-dependent dehydrogenase (short-subunit alcohol dehydrogenase family)